MIIHIQLISRAVKEEQEIISESQPDENPKHLTVSGDGTWKKRGFSSLFGVTTLIGKYSRKVVDTVVKSSFCQGCNLWKGNKSDIQAYEDWYEEHSNSCTINHRGSAGKMEVDAVVEMFNRSVEKHRVKYIKSIGDGDSKTFKGILGMNPYNDNPLVEKKECVGHIQKRMGARLRKAKKDNKGIGGKGAGKLTDKVINELSLYYGLAIRRHPECVQSMKNEIWTTFYHKSSTNEKPQHKNCPTGSSSWCKWQRAAAENTLKGFVHEHPPLNDKVLKVIEPIYTSLSSDDLLHRCLGSETQNNNESLNSLIWTFAPKHIHAGTQTIQIATYLAVAIFNEGYLPILQIMKLMGITVGTEAHTFVVRRNEVRIDRSELRASATSKEGRTARLAERTSHELAYEVEEGPMYGSGIAD